MAGHLPVPFYFPVCCFLKGNLFNFLYDSLFQFFGINPFRLFLQGEDQAQKFPVRSGFSELQQNPRHGRRFSAIKKAAPLKRDAATCFSSTMKPFYRKPSPIRICDFLFLFGLQQTVISIFSFINYIDFPGSLIAEHIELVIQKVHLQNCFVYA